MGNIVPKKFPPVTLHVADPHPQDSTVEISWCISPDTARIMNEEGARNPHILIFVLSVKPGFDKATSDHRIPPTIQTPVNRYVVPLTEGMCFVQFREPGIHILRATIIWDGKKTVDMVRSGILEQDRRRRPVKCYLGEDLKIRYEDLKCYTGIKTIEECGELEVDIDPKYFAKKPPQWLWAWANLWHHSKPIDQCDFRNRAFWSFVLQPWVMLIWAISLCLFRTGYVICLFFIGNWRAIKIRGVFWPIVGSDRIYATCVKYYWFHDPKPGFSITANPFLTDSLGRDREGAFAFLYFLNPIVLIGTGLALVFIGKNLYKFYQRLDATGNLGWTIGIGIGILVGIIVATVLLSKIFRKKIDGKISPRKARKEEKRRIKQEQEQLRKKQEEEELAKAVGVLVCNPEAPPPTTFNDLPPERRTIRLRFWDLKRQVCRPFADN